MSFVAGLVTACLACAPQALASTDAAAWEQQARSITIIRDDYGIPHIHGKTDADAVFGLIYAQAEDDFNRVETNYLSAMGRLAEAEGESAVYRDLRMKLFIAPDSIQAQFAASPDWLKKLMNAWADGLNFYLYKHPDVKPRVLTRFEPWMALTFSEGSIGGDIESISLSQLEAFYGKAPKVVATEPEQAPRPEPTGSNGFAIAPANSASHHALLLINPHTSFFFRAEVQVASDEGLNAYGAVTWGQFFVYQGFNEHAGWMHTSSGVDNIDEYAETVVKQGDGFSYRHGSQERPVTTTKISVPYKSGAGLAQKEFTVYRTHHGPVVREADGKWVSVTLMEEPVKALTQSYTRTKARNYQAFKETMQLHTNSSNNTSSRTARGTSRTSTPTSSRGATPDSIGASRSTAPTRRRIGKRSSPWTRRPACSTLPMAGSTTRTTRPGRRRGRTARSSRTIRAMWKLGARISGASMRSACWAGNETSRSPPSSPRPTTATSRRSKR